MTERRFASYLREQLLEPVTWVTALVVGTFINLYGHALVPWFRGEADVVGRFVREWSDAPGLTLLSLVLGYAFPVLVGTWASARAKWTLRHTASRAEFPDRKPDPVFRARPDGSFVDVGQGTAALFERFHVHRAQDVLGEHVWAQLLEAARGGGNDEAIATVHFEPAGHWYLVGYAPGSEGTMNVYLTRVPPRLAAGGAA